MQVTEPGGPEVLRMVDLAPPQPHEGEILVHVEAAGLNRADLLQRRGAYPAPAGSPSDILGLEFAGTVAAVGRGVVEWVVGDRVMGIVGGGAYAEMLTVDAGHAVRIPDDWDFTTAAAVPEAFVTAHDALAQAALESGDRLLIHAVGSGVGIAILQLGKVMGASITGTSRTPRKLARATELGLDRGILVSGPFEPDEALRNSADVVCDLVGGPYFPGTLAACAPRGRIVLIGLSGGRSATLDLGAVMSKRLTVIGTVLRGRSPEEKREIMRAFSDEVLPLFRTGAIRPLVDRVFPLRGAADAHRYVEANENFGPVVLEVQHHVD